MNKRQAKKKICRIAAVILECMEPGALTEYEERDYPRLKNAWSELIDELYDRGDDPKNPALTGENDENDR
jgi:hypothetical protein